MSMRKGWLICCSALLLCLTPEIGLAGQATVAVATNFLGPLRTLAADFEATTGHRLRISGGSTGKLYAQTVNGAPFDLLLAANAREPMRLEAEGRAVPGSRFSYARGMLALWSSNPDLVDQMLAGDTVELLRAGNFRRLAIANPNTAPYGAAAVDALKAMGVYKQLRGKLTRGENIGQAYQFVATGNAELGVLASSQLLAAGIPDGRWWPLPLDLYPDIDQQAVLLNHGADNPAALAFMAYLQTPATHARILAFGYREAANDAH